MWSSVPAVTAHDAGKAVGISKSERSRKSVATVVVERQDIRSTCIIVNHTSSINVIVTEHGYKMSVREFYKSLVHFELVVMFKSAFDSLLDVQIDTIRYNTRCYFNVRSKADMSQLNPPHERLVHNK